MCAKVSFGTVIHSFLPTFEVRFLIKQFLITMQCQILLGGLIHKKIISLGGNKVTTICKGAAGQMNLLRARSGQRAIGCRPLV